MPRKKDMKEYGVEHPDLYRIPIDGFFNAAFSVDCVIFGYDEGELKVLLIQSCIDPYEGYLALTVSLTLLTLPKIIS